MVVIGDAFGKTLTDAKNTTKKSQSEADKLQKYLKYFYNSWDYAKENYHQRWERNWKLYNNRRTKVNHPGKVEAFVPMTNSMVNTKVAALFNRAPSVNYIPNNKDQDADTAILNEVYQDFARKDNWVGKNKDMGRQGLITGNFCAYYTWINDKNGGYVHKEIIPVRDMIIDPNAKDPESWHYVGRRFFANLNDLKDEKTWDFDKEKYIPRYKNLDKIGKDGGSDENETDKAKKEEVIGSIAKKDKDTVELLEIWTRKEVVVIANRSAIIEEKENPHYAMEKTKFEIRKKEWELNRIETYERTGEDIGEFDEEFDPLSAGLLPFAHDCEYKDISLPYGTGDVDIIADQQELLNTITEIYVEAQLMAVFPEKQVDPKYATYIDQLGQAPGKVYPLPAGAMTWNTPPQIPTALFTERMNIKDEIREVSSVSQISKGVTATDTTTATEIKAMLGQSDLRIEDIAQNLANGFFYQEATIVFKLLQLYGGKDLYIRNITDAGVDFEQVDMDRFLGEYSPMVTLDVMKKLEDAEKREAYMQAYQMLIADPTNNLEKIKEYVLPKALPDLNKEELKEIIEPAQAPVEQPVEETVREDVTIPEETLPEEQPSLEEAYGV
jgi:hypothetical protein